VSSPPTTAAGRRRLPVLAFIILAALYLVAIHFAPAPFEKADAGYAQYGTTEDVLRGLLPTVVVGALIGIAVVSYLRWWRPVMRDEPELRAPRFVWVFPVIIVLAVLGGIQYSALADGGVAFTITLLIAALAGYFFYLARRVSGTLVLGMVLHGLWDFGIFTGLANGRDNLYLGTTLFIIADVIMLIIALATIRKVFPRREEHAEVGAD
jgi:cellobiose-specific phosphotransferase system component IIC